MFRLPELMQFLRLTMSRCSDAAELGETAHVSSLPAAVPACLRCSEDARHSIVDALWSMLRVCQAKNEGAQFLRLEASSAPLRVNLARLCGRAATEESMEASSSFYSLDSRNPLCILAEPS